MKKELIKYGVIFIMLLSIGLSSYYGIKHYLKIIDENSRLKNNFSNSQFELDSVKNKNGEYHVVVGGLVLEKNELKDFNFELTEEIKKLNIKLKNVGTITKIEYVYVYDIDTIIIEKLSDSIFRASYKDEWLELSQKVYTFNLGKDIKIDSVNINIKDGLTIVEEVEYKGWWFWKKAKGVKLHIDSENPHLNIHRTEYYKIQK